MVIYMVYVVYMLIKGAAQKAAKCSERRGGPQVEERRGVSGTGAGGAHKESSSCTLCSLSLCRVYG